MDILADFDRLLIIDCGVKPLSVGTEFSFSPNSRRMSNHQHPKQHLFHPNQRTM
jgi:hypothetical protein